MSARLAGRHPGAAVLIVMCLAASFPAGAAAAQRHGGPAFAASASIIGLPEKLADPLAGGLNPVQTLTSGIGALGLDALGTAVLNGAQAALQETATVIGQTTAPRLESTWFSSTYWRVAGLSAVLTLPFLSAAAMQALLRSDLTLLLRAAFGYLPLAMIGVSLAAPITMLLLSVTDQMSSVIAGAGMGGGVHFLRQTATAMAGVTALSGSPFLAIAIGLLTLGAAVALAIEMLVREAAMYVVVLMLPLAFAALVWPARRTWAVRILELLIALILSKFVIVAVLSLAGAAYGSSGSPSTTRLLTAMALVLLSTFAPWVMLRLLPFTELAAGAAGAMRAELPRLSAVPLEAMAAADGAAAWAERLTQRLRPGGVQSGPTDEAGPWDMGSTEPSRTGDPSSGAYVDPRSQPDLHSPGAPSAPSGQTAPEAAETEDTLGTTDSPAARQAQRLPGLSPRWQGEDGTIEIALGPTRADDRDGELTGEEVSPSVEGPRPEDFPLLPPRRDEEPPAPSTDSEG
jgi:hypothetical protein